MSTTLSEAQLRELRGILKQRREQVLEDIRRLLLRSDDERYIKLAGRVHDPQEESVADLLFDINLADISRNVREVRDIEQALIRIRTGTYGVCMDTGEPDWVRQT